MCFGIKNYIFHFSRRKRELINSGYGTCSELGKGAELCGVH